MQLVARDKQGELIMAELALPGRNYFCLECSGALRCRMPTQRRAHFFHLQKTKECRQAGKSLAHLQVQLYLQRCIGSEHAHVEHRFASIGRIADVCWPSERLIFEVQCSFISAEEVQKRCFDYASQGYQVIWVLHEQFFQKRWMKAAERVLIDIPHYYTDMKADGVGSLYDRYVHYQGAFRVHAMPKLRIDPCLPLRYKGASHAFPVYSYRKRLSVSNIYFCGDLIDQVRREPEQNYLQQVGRLQAADAKKASLWTKAMQRARRVYTVFLHGMLESLADR